MLAGESVLSLVAATGVREQTLLQWRTQGRVDVGLAVGVTSTESHALRDAHRRTKRLHADLTLVKAASDIFDAQPVVDSRDDRPSR